MILLHDKKKGYKNILKAFAPLILSFHIHFIAFIVFFTYQQKNQEIRLNQNYKKNILHVKIIKNFDNSEEKSFENKNKATKLTKNKFHKISQSQQKKNGNIESK